MGNISGRSRGTPCGGVAVTSSNILTPCGRHVYPPQLWENKSIEGRSGGFYDDPRPSRPLARTSTRSLGADLSHAPHVDADRRQSSPRAEPEGQPLVGSSLVRELDWLDDLAHSLFRRNLRGAV